MCQGKMKFCKNIREFYISALWSWDVWSRCIFFAKFIKFSPPILSGKFEFWSGKCQGVVREFWSVLHVWTLEYPQHCFRRETRKISIFLDWKKASCQELWAGTQFLDFGTITVIQVIVLKFYFYFRPKVLIVWRVGILTILLLRRPMLRWASFFSQNFTIYTHVIASDKRGIQKLLCPQLQRSWRGILLLGCSSVRPFVTLFYA